MNKKRLLHSRVAGAMLALLLGMSLSGCAGQSSKTESEIVYSAGFDTFKEGSFSNSLTPIDEMGKLQNIFYSELGITSSPFTLKGTTEECDKQITDACDKAVAKIQQQTWQAHFVFRVYNALTEQVIFRYEYPTPQANQQPQP